MQAQQVSSSAIVSVRMHTPTQALHDITLYSTALHAWLHERTWQHDDTQRFMAARNVGATYTCNTDVYMPLNDSHSKCACEFQIATDVHKNSVHLMSTKQTLLMSVTVSLVGISWACCGHTVSWAYCGQLTTNPGFQSWLYN